MISSFCIYYDKKMLQMVVIRTYFGATRGSMLMDRGRCITAG